MVSTSARAAEVGERVVDHRDVDRADRAEVLGDHEVGVEAGQRALVEVVEVLAAAHRLGHERVDLRGRQPLRHRAGRHDRAGLRASTGWSHSKVTPDHVVARRRGRTGSRSSRAATRRCACPDPDGLASRDGRRRGSTPGTRRLGSGALARPPASAYSVGAGGLRPHLVEIHRPTCAPSSRRLRGAGGGGQRGRGADAARGRARRCTRMSSAVRTTGRLGCLLRSPVLLGFVNGSPHAVEDTSVFPHRRSRRARCRARAATGSPEEHVVIHHLLDDVDGAGALGQGAGRRHAVDGPRSCSATPSPTRSAAALAGGPARGRLITGRRGRLATSESRGADRGAGRADGCAEPGPRGLRVRGCPTRRRPCCSCWRWRGWRRGSWTRSSAAAG